MRNQSIKKKKHYSKWGLIFIFSCICMICCMCGIIVLPGNYIVYIVSYVTISMVLSVLAFYKWIYGFLYAYRRNGAVNMYPKNRLYIIATLNQISKQKLQKM